MGEGRETQRYYEKPLLTYAMFLAALQLFTLALSELRIEFSAAISSAVFALSALTACLLTLHGAAARVEPAQKGGQSRLVVAAILFALGAAVCCYAPLLDLALTTLDSSYDGNSYHIPPIERWREKGYVHWISLGGDIGVWQVVLVDLGNGLSKGAELVGFLLTYLIGDIRGASLSNALFVPLGVLAFACLGEIFGASRGASLCAALLFLFVPSAIQQFPTTYVDVALACAEAAALAFFAAAASRIQGGDEHGRAVCGLGVCLGLAIAVKGTGFLAVAALFAGLAAAHALTPRGPAARMRGLLRDGAAAAAGCALVGGYWYVRNYLHTGNPLYPIGVSLFGHSIFPGPVIFVRIDGLFQVPLEMRQFTPPMRVLWTWLQAPGSWPDSIRGYDSRRGGFGFVWLLWCLPAVAAAFLFFLKKSRLATARVALLTLAAGTAIYLLKPMPWWPRYTLCAFALGLPCLALLIERAVSARSIPGGIWLASGFGWSLAEGFIALLFSLSLQNASACRFGDGAVLFPRAFMGLNGALACEALRGPGAVALSECAPDCETFSGPLGYDLRKRKVFYLSDRMLADSAADRLLRENGVRWLFWDERSPPAREVQAREVRTERVGEYAVLSELSLAR